MEEWYYAQEGKQVGPVSRGEIQQLIRAKQISAETLVWKDGMADWQKLGSLSARKGKSGENADQPEQETVSQQRGQTDAETMDAEYAPVSDSEEDSGAGQIVLKQKETGTDDADPGTGQAVLRQKKTGESAGSPQIVCSQCGRSFPQDEIIRYQGTSICAECKPLFIQKLKEGANVQADMEYGGFWIRLAAKIIDAIAVGIIQMIVSFPLGLMLGFSDSSDSAMLIGQGVNLLFSLIMPIIYTTWFLGRYAATPGKMACRLRVVSAYGERISYMAAFGRTMAEWLSSLILCIGYLMAAFDEEKRTLHDRICNTRVIRI